MIIDCRPRNNCAEPFGNVRKFAGSNRLLARSEQQSMGPFPVEESHQHDLNVQEGIPIFDVIDIATNAFA